MFDSPVLKISGAGRYDLVADQLDLSMAASLLGSYSKFLKGIPLFGKLLKGDRPGLGTALFEVRGSLRDPKVRYLPIESFAKGLTGYPRLALDVLINTITLPKGVITPGRPAREAPR